MSDSAWQPRTRQCRSKRRHRSRSEAITAMDLLAFSTGQRGLLNVYRCPWCRSWHVGHKS